jgi:RNA polymerase-binding transcription factor DksA
MDFNLISEFKKKLVAVKDALTRQITSLKKPVDMGDDVDSFEEEADEATEMVANAGMVETLKKRAHRVEDALAKMEKGAYGICEKCKKEIEPELLQIDPESRYCRACKLAMAGRS